ncbi:uncharacterized protein [Cardiocondyla obscurior]|uniref:uncharacterized protein n=1 Tax=Cardiocondyla obscurior TaxID=286306 RepID=UPI003965792B
MNTTNELKNHETIVKKIAQTSDSIRKKYHAMKTGKMDEDIALERHFKPIVETLKQIVENTDVNNEAESVIPKNELYYSGEEEMSTPKHKRSALKRKRVNATSSITTSTPKRVNATSSMLKRSNTDLHTLNETSKTAGQQNLSHEFSHANSIDEIFNSVDTEQLVTSIRQQLQTADGWKILQTHYGPLGQKYLGAVLSGKKSVTIDSVYGVYFNDSGTMIGSKRIELDKNDDIFIDGKKYPGTVGLYELIFMKFPNESSYTDIDKQYYKSILLSTNAHKRDYSEQNQVKSNKGHKYKSIIAPLLDKKVGQDIPSTVILNDNKIDYIHWNDRNEFVDRLRLLEASRHAGHNAHDNEILSIIEELREAGLIIN